MSFEFCFGVVCGVLCALSILQPSYFFYFWHCFFFCTRSDCKHDVILCCVRRTRCIFAWHVVLWLVLHLLYFLPLFFFCLFVPFFSLRWRICLWLQLVLLVVVILFYFLVTLFFLFFLFPFSVSFFCLLFYFPFACVSLLQLQIIVDN